MVERFNVVSISLFKCACCHAYVVFCVICVACSDCGLVNYAFSHAFFLERACFLVPASAWVYDLTLWLASSTLLCRAYFLRARKIMALPKSCNVRIEHA